MEPMIVAASIAGGAAVLTGAAGFAATAFGMRSARRNLERAMDGERARQLWDRRASAYVDTLAHVRHQEQVWDNELKRIRISEGTEDAERDRLATFGGPAAFELEARLVAYGSSPFRVAFAEWSNRQAALVETYREWRKQFSGPPAPFLRRPRELDTAYQAFKAATLDLANVGNGELQAGTPARPRRDAFDRGKW